MSFATARAGAYGSYLGLGKTPDEWSAVAYAQLGGKRPGVYDQTAGQLFWPPLAQVATAFRSAISQAVAEKDANGVLRLLNEWDAINVNHPSPGVMGGRSSITGNPFVTQADADLADSVRRNVGSWSTVPQPTARNQSLDDAIKALRSVMSGQTVQIFGTIFTGVNGVLGLQHALANLIREIEGADNLPRLGYRQQWEDVQSAYREASAWVEPRVRGRQPGDNSTTALVTVDSPVVGKIEFVDAGSGDVTIGEVRTAVPEVVSSVDSPSSPSITPAETNGGGATQAMPGIGNVALIGLGLAAFFLFGGRKKGR